MNENPDYYSNSEEWNVLFSSEILESDAQHRISKITLTDKCKNPHKFLHGGVQGLMADELTMKFIYPAFPKYRFLTESMDIQYKKPMRIVPFIYDATISELDLNKNCGVVSIKFRNEANTIVYTTISLKFTMYLKKEYLTTEQKSNTILDAYEQTDSFYKDYGTYQ